MAPAKKQPAHYITLHDKRYPIIATKHAKARHIVVRYDPRREEVRLTLPKYVSLARGLAFVEERREWLLKRKDEHPTQIPFAPGTIILFLGDELTLIHKEGRGTTERVDNELIVFGDVQFFKRRIIDWLKKELRREIEPMLNAHAPERYKGKLRLHLRETTSRWGSCSKDGNITLCWRLVFAPREIVYYVVCHELAHLTHLNHSAAYWRHLATLYPNVEHAEKWLREHGVSLWRFGS